MNKTITGSRQKEIVRRREWGRKREERGGVHSEISIAEAQKDRTFPLFYTRGISSAASICDTLSIEILLVF